MELSLPSTSTAPAPTSGEPVLVICHLCNKQFQNGILRNLHLKRFHKAPVNKKASNIKCPLCKDEEDLQNHEALRNHLEKHHQLNIKFLSLQFSKHQEFGIWKDNQEIKTKYAMHRSIKKAEYKMLYIDCNRSDHKGYRPKYFKRTEKSGGTIKMNGVCPSRLVCKLNKSGEVLVNYWKTHAGHDEELRSKHLSKSEESSITSKRQSGIPSMRILEDERKMEAPQLGRINIITSQDISNLSRKHNIHKHVHLVRMYEERMGPNSVLDQVAQSLGEKSDIKKHDQEEINKFIIDRVAEANQATEVQGSIKRSLQWAQFKDFAEGLDDTNFSKFMKDIQGTIHKYKEKASSRTQKRKMDKQDYFPAEQLKRD